MSKSWFELLSVADRNSRTVAQKVKRKQKREGRKNIFRLQVEEEERRKREKT